LVSAVIFTACGPASRNDPIHVLDRKGSALSLCFQLTEDVRNLSGRQRRLYFYPAVRQLLHFDFRAGLYAQVLKQVLSQGDLTLRCNGKRAHDEASGCRPTLHTM
jgi:hypothetical protein